MKTRICRTCNRELPLSEFYQWSNSNRIDVHCKECAREKRKPYEIRHRAHKREYMRSYYQRNKEYMCLKHKEWIEKNRDTHNEYAKKTRAKNKDYIAEKQRSYRALNDEKMKAYRKLHWALKTGKIERLTKCEICGSERNVEAHHEDYSKPLDVIWCCKKCHWELDEERRALETT